MGRHPELLDVQPKTGLTSKIDPTHLPIKFDAPDRNADGGARAVELSSERVVMARRLGPVAMRIALPISAYQGVAMRLLPGATELEDRFEVRLVHQDSGLDVPLYEAADDENVIAEWRRWAGALGLPLLLEGADGALIATEKRMGALEISRTLPRRRRSFLSRRPRFLARRRAGKRPLVPLVHRDEREIIARS